ncbi:hypothetical protein [Hydrogenophaga palleronii]
MSYIRHKSLCNSSIRLKVFSTAPHLHVHRRQLPSTSWSFKCPNPSPSN